MKRRTALALLGPALALAIAVVAFLGWYGDLKQARDRWEAKVEALEAAGVPLTEAAHRPPSSPDHANAAPLLLAVEDAYEAAVQKRVWEPLDRIGDPDVAFTDAELRDLDAAWPLLAPIYEQIAAAADRPALVFEGDDESVAVVTMLQDLLHLETRRDPARGLDGASTLLRLATRWGVATTVEALWRGGLYQKAACMRRDALALSGSAAVPDATAFDDLLRRAEGTLVEDYRRMVAFQRTYVLEYVSLCTGERELEEGSLDEEVIERDRSILRRAHVYERGVAELDRIDVDLAEVRTLDDLRRAPPPPPPPPPHSSGPGRLAFPSWFFQRHALETLAVLRLTRVGLVIEGERRRGRPLERDLQAYAGCFPEGLPLDPYTGRPFRWTLTDGRGRLEADVGAVVSDLQPSDWDSHGPAAAVEALRDAGLLWDLPAGP